ncbi:MAG: hypothetical protein ACLUEQ_04465 [Cloacibacillus evryensis]
MTRGRRRAEPENLSLPDHRTGNSASRRSGRCRQIAALGLPMPGGSDLLCSSMAEISSYLDLWETKR